MPFLAVDDCDAPKKFPSSPAIGGRYGVAIDAGITSLNLGSNHD